MEEPTARIRSVLRHIDPVALRPAIVQETKARQRHLPPVSVYRWWARRTETVIGAVVDAISADQPGRLLLADAFAGGGVIALAGLLRGHRVYAQDVNPWAAQSLATMVTLPEADAIESAGGRLKAALQKQLTEAYGTTLRDGTPAEVAHTLRVATAPCLGCARTLRLFPSALVSLTTRVDTGGTEGWMACPAGHITLGPATKRTRCGTCNCYVFPNARYTTNREVRCRDCRWSGKLADLVAEEPFGWVPVLVERCGAGRREVDEPTPSEIATADDARWHPSVDLGEIADGIETAVLLRHGMNQWHDLYPARQRVLLEQMLSSCVQVAGNDASVLRTLRTAVIGSTEMAGLASRWDSRYLKPYEAVANHRFNFTTLAVEPHMWGVAESGRGTVDRRIRHLAKASIWLDEQIGRPLRLEGPIAAEQRRTTMSVRTDVRVAAGSSARIVLPDESVDAVITDPPYHDDVHYGELSDLFRAWSGSGTGPLDGDAVVRRSSSETDGTAAYEALLGDVFTEVHRALRTGGHLLLSYANRYPAAWVALFNALQAAGFRAVGFTVVQSENGSDYAKVGRRACTLDVLIDLVKSGHRPLHPYRPTGASASVEDAFCRLVGDWSLRIGSLPADWQTQFEPAAKAAAFLRKEPD